MQRPDTVAVNVEEMLVHHDLSRRADDAIDLIDVQSTLIEIMLSSELAKIARALIRPLAIRNRFNV
jgi:hypothetical protein